MRMTKLLKAGEKAVKQSLRLRKGETFLLVTDKEKLEIAEAFAYWAKELGAETTTYLMTETLRLSLNRLVFSQKSQRGQMQSLTCLIQGLKKSPSEDTWSKPEWSMAGYA
jgi:leucyl aminopeptidase (aminopeptidase T)